MAEKRNTAVKTAPTTTRNPAGKAAEPAASTAGKTTANGADSTAGARAREAAAATSAGLATKPQERSPAPAAARAVAKATKAPRAAAKATSAPRAGAGGHVTDYDELAAVGQENLEACVRCGTIVAKGMETLGKEVISFTQTVVEANLIAARNVLTAKNWHEVIDMQSDFARNRFESVAAETAKLGEISLQVANQALEPIQSRIDISAQKLFQPLAL